VAPLDAVAKLMEERGKYEAFLRELDKGGSAKPAHVVAKVRADYTEKLAGVMEQLKENREVLTQHATTLATRLQELEASEKKIVDEHAEAELRKQVGELSDVDWELASKKAESALMKLKQDQQVTASDINRIRDILSGLSAAETVSKPAVDELAFLKSVVGSGTTGALPKAPSAPLPPPARTSAPTPAPRPSTAAQQPRSSGAYPNPRPSAPTPAPRPSVVARQQLIEPDPMDVQAAPDPDATPPTGVKPVPTAKESLVEPPQSDITLGSKVKGDKPLAANVPSGDIQLKAKNSFQANKKTLKCKECGTLNSPSEWYCERCGAELAQI